MFGIGNETLPLESNWRAGILRSDIGEFCLAYWSTILHLTGGRSQVFKNEVKLLIKSTMMYAHISLQITRKGFIQILCVLIA